MTDTQGPYQPTWTNRRRLMLFCLAFSGGVLLGAWAGVLTIPEEVQLALIWLDSLLITWYLMGSSAEDLAKIFTWKKG